MSFVIRVCMALAAGAMAASGAVTITAVEPTALFPRATPLRQVAIVTLRNSGDQAVEVEVQADGPSAKAVATPGTSRHRVLVADREQPGKVAFVVKRAGSAETLATEDRTWQPQRKWKVYVVKSSHEDLGYENYIFKKQHDIANFIDLADDLSGPAENVTELERKTDARYHYTMESLLFQRNYIEERGERAWREIVERSIKPGRMNLMGAPSGVASHWMDYEELARMTYAGRRESKDRFGLDLKTFMIVDNPSLSWSGMQAVSEAGFKYVARWGQGWRTGGNNDYKHTQVPALFWWQAPDGQHRVLFGWRSHYGQPLWYGQSGGGYGNLVDLASDNLAKHLREVEDGTTLGPYPYDALINPEYIDHDIPRFDTRVLPVWAEKYAYPEIKISGPDQFFEYIERKYGPQLPVLRGDLNNFSADYATIDPESHGWKRDAARMLPAAEGLAALASAFDPGFFLSPAFVHRTYTRLHDFDEHSWPTLPHPSDVQLFNAAWVKKAEARRALSAAQEALRLSSTAFAAQIRSSGDGSIAVFNSLAHPRTDVVRMQGSCGSMTDVQTGRSVPCQKVGDGEVAFLASDVPALGYKVFRVSSASEQNRPTFEVTKDSLANEFYSIRFDPVTGAIRSIVEKQTGRELVDSKAPYLANQMIYVHKNEREAKDGFMHSPKKALRMEGSQGPVQAEFRVWIEDEKTQAAIQQTVILYAGLKRIDIVNRLEHARALFSKNYEDRYRDNIFYAFPFAVENGQPRVEYPGGVVRPYTDQLRWGSHDFLYANRWVDVSNANHGVTIVPWNEGTFHFGEIRYNQFSIDYKPQSPWLFSFGWSNRMAELLTLNGDDCNATLGYSLISHNGDWDSGETTRFAWSTASPLIAIRLLVNPSGRFAEPSRSFLSVDAANVQLTVLKNSELPGRGWVARFVETQGKATEFTVEASTLGPDRAQECDLVENDRGSLTVSGGKVRVRIAPYGHATIRLERGIAPGRVSGLVAKATGDEGVGLTWPAVKDAAAYHVFRSDDPDAPPSAYTLLARTATPSYTDQGLHIKTRYSYYVSAVNAFHVQGPVSDRVEAMPDGKNVSPPAQVAELGVVRRAKDTLMVYWRSNTDPDIARYRVYRGTTPEFGTEGLQPLATMDAAKFFLQLYVDRGLQAGTTYYYKVFAEDWAGNRQAVSPVGAGTTPAY